MCHCSTAISPLGNRSATTTITLSVTLWIFSLTPSISASAAPPCSITTTVVSSKFGVLGGKFYQERIWLQDLNTTLTRGTSNGGVSPGVRGTSWRDRIIPCPGQITGSLTSGNSNASCISKLPILVSRSYAVGNAGSSRQPATWKISFRRCRRA